MQINRYEYEWQINFILDHIWIWKIRFSVMSSKGVHLKWMVAEQIELRF